MDSTYKTFWKRFFAGFVDSVVLALIAILINSLTPSRGDTLTFLQTVLDNSIWLIYSICLHGKYGQTIGKMVFKIKVVTVSGNDITFLQAFKRDVVYLILAVAILTTFSTHKEEYASYNESVLFIESFEATDQNYDADEVNYHLENLTNVWGTPAVWVGYISLIYFLLEVITMLTNKKRRAIHDFIAGTEVRRLE